MERRNDTQTHIGWRVHMEKWLKCLEAISRRYRQMSKQLII